MVDKNMALTFSVRNNPGVYSLLLGSGVSAGAGIPTGGGIVEDLIGKIAEVEEEEPDDLFDWYEQKYEEEPVYDNIIEGLASSKEERRNLLEEYFEPSNGNEDGDKTPSDAHKSIAWLMDEGYINVVLTTNFDNLLEQALRERGVEPTVISTTATARSAEPLTHTGPVILKIHGDYKETNLKNTTDELSSYEEPMKDLIDEVLNDYGLIICGWSGETDTALREAILGSQNRHYTTYWTHRGEVSDIAERIISQRDGFKIQIEGADKFFSELKENVRALENAEEGAPLTREIIRERVKHYLSRKERRIDLADILQDETERVHNHIFDYSSFPLSVDDDAIFEDVVEERLDAYEQQLEKLVIATTTCAYWEPEVENTVSEDVVSTVERIGTPTSMTGHTFTPALKWLRGYPACRLVYGVGTATIEGQNWDLLVNLLDTEAQIGGSTFHSAPEELHPMRIAADLPISGGQLKARLRDSLRNSLENLIPDNNQYKDSFYKFELIMDLVAVSRTPTPTGDYMDSPWGAYPQNYIEKVEEEYESGGGIQEVLERSIQPHPQEEIPVLFDKFHAEQPRF